MHAVLGGVAPLPAVGRWRIIPADRSQSAREIINDSGDVIIERAAREPRGRRELRVTPNRLPP
jgi:hypothetical protein